MKIIVLSRLSKEKNIPRLIEFAKNVPKPCSIDLFGSGDTSLLENHGTCINYMGPVQDAARLIKSYDYLALLSDSEGYPYAVVEALSRQVPVLVTPFEEAKNIVQDGINGYILPLDVRTFDYSKLLEVPKPPKYIPKSTPETWINYFNKHIKRVTMKKRIRVIGENITFAIGEVVEVSQKRADKAVRIGVAEYVGPDVPVTMQDPEDTTFVKASDNEGIPTPADAPPADTPPVVEEDTKPGVEDIAVTSEEISGEPVPSEVVDAPAESAPVVEKEPTKTEEAPKKKPSAKPTK